jgi:dynactin 1
VEEIKAMAAVNVDAERKITQQGEEIQELVRGIKSRVSLSPLCGRLWLR